MRDGLNDILLFLFGLALCCTIGLTMKKIFVTLWAMFPGI